MARLIWAIPCTKSTIDSTTNNVSLIEIIEQLEFIGRFESGKQAVVPLQFEFVVMHQRAEENVPESIRCRLLMAFPDGHEQPGVEFVADLTAARRHRNKIIISGMPVTTSGDYQLCVEHFDETSASWDRKFSYPLQIKITVETPAPQPVS